MAEKIILFVSILPESSGEQFYSAPNGKRYCGRQTNEAPVKYLLDVHPEISDILCIATEEAQTECKNVKNLGAKRDNAWKYFCAKIEKTPEKIDWKSGQSFESEIMPQILEKLEADDRIYLETSGGKRDNVMYLTLLSRALTYQGITIGQAVYSDFGECQIKDITNQYRLFDLIAGMQDMASFGNVGKLREYLNDTEKDDLIADLLNAMENLFEDITLCRTAKIDVSMNAFNQALQSAANCTNPLIRQLLPAFRKKFGEDKKLTTPRLIQWCLDSDMVQQALTVYTERIPAYIIDTAKILEVSEKEFDRIISDNQAETEYLDPYTIVLTEGFLKLANKKKIWRQNNDDAFITTLRNFKICMKDSPYKTSYRMKQLHQILLDYIFLKDIRNMINHANAESTAYECHLEYYKENKYPNMNGMNMAELKQFIREAIGHLEKQ